MKDANHLIRERANEKIAKHKPGCDALSRKFIASVFNTTGGMGPIEFWKWFDGIFIRAANLERAAGGTGQNTSFRRLTAIAIIQSTLVKLTADTVHATAIDHHNGQPSGRARQQPATTQNPHRGRPGYLPT